MSAPNLLASTTVTGKTALALLTTATANVLTNSSGSNTVVKVENIILSNYTAVVASANVIVNRSATSYYLGGSVSIPANSTLESCSLRTNTSGIFGEFGLVSCITK